MTIPLMAAKKITDISRTWHQNSRADPDWP